MKKFLWFIIVCGLWTNVIYGQNHRVSVDFFKNKKKIDLQDDFKIYIVLQDSLKTTVIKPFITNNSFIMPAFEKGKNADIIFRYKKHLIRVYRSVYLNRDVSFDFGVNYKPFSQRFTDGEKLQGVKCINYLAIPTYKVIGINKIKHPKKYRRRILKLIE